MHEDAKSDHGLEKRRISVLDRLGDGRTGRGNHCASPHSENPGVEVQRALGVFDAHHGLLHDKVLAALVRICQVGLIVLAGSDRLLLLSHNPNELGRCGSASSHTYINRTHTGSDMGPRQRCLLKVEHECHADAGSGVPITSAREKLIRDQEWPIRNSWRAK